MRQGYLRWLKIAVFWVGLTLPAGMIAMAAAPVDEAAQSAESPFLRKIKAILRTPPPAEQPPEEAAYKETSIFGPAEVSKEQMAEFIRRKNPLPRLDCSVEELVEIYYEEAALEGVRPDLALAQAIVETGFFRYGSDVLPEQNNFCGLGTTGKGARGAWFTSPRIGVRAHIQHLLAYSTDREPRTPIVDPRYSLVRGIKHYAAQ